jgi:hypothetical protein
MKRIEQKVEDRTDRKEVDQASKKAVVSGRRVR